MFEQVAEFQHLKVLEGSILDVPNEWAIVHQCNCASVNYHGVAKFIFDKWPFSNEYDQERMGWYRTYHVTHSLEKSTELKKALVSGVDLKEVVGDSPTVINMYTQMCPGKPRFPRERIEREVVFYEALKLVLQEDTETTFALPYKIGCDLAGGNWEDYFHLINLAAEKNLGKQVYLIKLPEVELDESLFKV